MNMIGSIIQEQGITFVIILVHHLEANTDADAARTRAKWQPYFENLPVILAYKDSKGELVYQGRPDIARFLAGIAPDRIPWAEYRDS